MTKSAGFRNLQRKRYGDAEQAPPPDSADGVVLALSIEKSTEQ